jgi:phage baseplate assembly protein gpV
MSVDKFVNAMKAVASQATSSQAKTRHGTVQSYDPNAYAVKVMFQPDGVLSGWLPLKSAWIGNGWGLFCPPSIGDAVEIDFQEADGGVGSLGWRFFNDADRPLPCPAGEFWIVHKAGALLKFHADGSIEMSTPGTLTTSAAQWNHNGPITVTNGDVLADGKSLKTHIHSGVSAGFANTGAPV